MNRHRWIVAALGALATVLSAPPARAQTVTIINANYDALTPTYSYQYAYSQMGTTSATGGIQAGTGVGGTAGYRVVADFTGAGGSNFAGFGTGNGQIPLTTPLMFPTSLGQFTYSFALSLSGFAGGAPPTTGLNFELTFLAPDNTIQPADPDPDADVILRVNLDPAPSYNTVGGFQTLAGNFGGGTASAGSLAQLQTFFAAVFQVQLNTNFNGGLDFGFDGGNVAVVDNLILTQVPEPSALLLAGLIAVPAYRRWRKG